MTRRKRFPTDRRGLVRKVCACRMELYLTLNCFDDGTPGELFITIAKQGSTISALFGAIATSISIGLQHGVPWETFRGKFIDVKFEPSDEINPSLLHAIVLAVDEMVAETARRRNP